MTVPNEAIKAAAKWLHDQDCRSALHSGFQPDLPCYDWSEEAKELLGIVAPFIAAQAWGEGEYAGYMNHSAEQRHGVEPHKNPYRSGNE